MEGFLFEARSTAKMLLIIPIIHCVRGSTQVIKKRKEKVSGLGEKNHLPISADNVTGFTENLVYL